MIWGELVALDRQTYNAEKKNARAIAQTNANLFIVAAYTNLI